ncbi:MAG: polyphosphate kinase 1 [Anaerolineales bacterium]|nr:polyphosphate kinase 1 [Chloroflexota bacterium]MBL6981521.1 polyphosphate kinase 1 [Anaerolineales bacterium]
METTEIAGAPEKKQYNIGHSTYYINRELGMLAFQERVFKESMDARNPLVERIKFLAFVGLNLDEFYMVRVGGLKMQNDAGILKLSIDGKTPAEQLAAIRKTAYQLMKKAIDHLHNDLLPNLAEAGVNILDYDQLITKQKSKADDYFHEIVFPVLTPLAFDPGHPFPHISNLSLNLAVLLQDHQGQRHFARVKVPSSLPRFVPIKRSSGSTKKDGTVPHNHYFVLLDQLIAHHLHTLFPGMEMLEVHPFRVTRNADMTIQELEAADLLEAMEESVRKRRFGAVVNLSVNPDMPDFLLDILIENLRVDPNDVYKLDGPLGLSSLMELQNVDRFDLKYKPFIHNIPSALRLEGTDGTIFAAIRKGDILLHHPYDSFDPIVNFLNSAARDPNVLAIKLTLYRVGRNSPVVKALLRARRDYGKQVAVLVELKARFDEESNIEWAKMLEREGVHVTYGLLGLKTHSKIILVVRKENDHIRRYIHLGTGNYHHVTAKLYEDMGMFTCDEEIGADATDLFNYLTGYSAQREFRKLLVAPINLRKRLEELIHREIQHQEEGKEGHIIFKMNALVDKPIIKMLYKASQAGVKIDLVVRSMCSLKPGIEGLSDNIRVISLLGRFLEHSRIYYFHNAGEEEIYMGSADLMPRNLNNRVEVIFPISDLNLIRRIRDTILKTYLEDCVKAHLMDSEGNFTRLELEDNGKSLAPQEWFIRRAQREMES